MRVPLPKKNLSKSVQSFSSISSSHLHVFKMAFHSSLSHMLLQFDSSKPQVEQKARASSQLVGLLTSLSCSYFTPSIPHDSIRGDFVIKFHQNSFKK